MTKGELWKMKNADIQAIADTYNVEYSTTTFNKKEVIPGILLAMIDAGDFIAKEDLSSTKVPYALVNFAHVTGEPDYVYIGVQGKAYYVPRNIDVPITHEMLGVVQTAVTYKVENVFDRQGRTKMRKVAVPTIPVAVIQQNYDMTKYLNGK